MAIIDDLKGILSPEDFNKLSGNTAMKAKLDKADELYTFYVGEEEPGHNEPNRPAATTTNQDPNRNSPPPALDLSSIESLLDKKLGKINETIETRVNEIVQTRGNELLDSAVRVSVARADELNRIYIEHSQNFGESFDSAKFNEYLMKPENSVMDKNGKRIGHRFRSLHEAYQDMVRPELENKRIEAEVAKRVNATSGSHVPGTTPPPATNNNIRVLMKRGTSADGTPTTGAGRAAAMLDRLQNDRNSAAS